MVIFESDRGSTAGALEREKLQGEAMIPTKGDIISEGITYGATQQDNPS